MTTPLILEQQITANPGDDFTFNANPVAIFGTQYHFQIDGANSGLVIGVWDSNGKGKARNKPNQAYVDRSLAKGLWRITVTGATQPYQIVVTKNSWFHKVFGTIPESMPLPVDNDILGYD